MRKSSRKMVSLMVAASMMFTTVMANASYVNASAIETMADAVTITPDAVASGAAFGVEYLDAAGAKLDADGNLQGSTNCAFYKDAEFSAKYGNADTTSLPVGTVIYRKDGEAAVKYTAPADGTFTINFAGTATKATVAIDSTGAIIATNGATGESTLTFAVKANQVYYIMQTGGKIKFKGATFTEGATITPDEPVVETTTNSSETPDEASTDAQVETTTSEAPAETTTEATVAIDLGTYDPASTGTQVRVEVNGEYGTAKVSTGDEITANFILSGNTGFNSYEALIAYDPAFVEFVEAVKPADSAEKADFVTYVNEEGDTKYPVSFATINGQNTTFTNAGKAGIIKLSATMDANTTLMYPCVVTGNGILAQVKFKVTGTEGAGYIAWLTGELNGETAEGFGNTETGLLNCNYTGTKLVIGSTEESTEATTSSDVVEDTTSSDVTEPTTEATTATTEETTETTTKRHSSGGGGGSSSSNAAKENNSKADSTIGSTTAQGNKTDSSNSSSSSTTKPSATQTSVGATETPSGITINPPALKNADGEIVAGSALNSSSLVSTNNFNDMATRAWAQDAVNKLSSIGVINGVGEGKFAPDATSKRGDFMVMLTKVLGVTGTPSTSFADVPANKYYANAVNLAKDLGLANGVGDNKFNPEAPITRQDMMVLTAKALEVVGYDVTSTDVSVLDKYADSNKIADYAKPYVAFLIENGLVNGTSNTTVDPTANMTRAQMAVLMSNLYDLITDAVLEAQDEAVEEEVTEETEATDEEATEATEEVTDETEATDEEVTEETEVAADEEAAADETDDTEIEAEK